MQSVAPNPTSNDCVAKIWQLIKHISVRRGKYIAKMRGLDIEYYMPVLVMLLIQSIYSGMNLSTRIALLEGMNPAVFVIYRNAFATIFLAPIAYLYEYVILYYYYFSSFFFCCLLFLNYSSSLSCQMCLLIICFSLFSFDRRNSASYSLNLRSFSWIFMTSLIRFVFIF